MKVAIVGYGFVGKALHNALTEDVKIIIIDPILGTSIDEIVSFQPQFVFLTLPTPMKKDGGQDISIIKKTFKELSDFKIRSNIVLKSTVTPDNLLYLSKSMDFIYNPEFLREKSAKADFINGKIIIFGGSNKLCEEASNFYSSYTLCKEKEHFITDIVTASLVKYTVNSFLATKVIFFNQLRSLLDLSDSDESWENFSSSTSCNRCCSLLISNYS